VRGNNMIERLYATYMPSPFLSMLIDDCTPGRDYHDGGPRYNATYIQGVGRLDRRCYDGDQVSRLR
jgi:formate C-acetyltransferase